MHQHFHAIGTTVGKQISTVRLRRTEHRHDPRQRGFSAGAHVHGLGGEPDGVDADHRSRSRRKAEHAAAFSAANSPLLRLLNAALREIAPHLATQLRCN
ncbi:hypothetical protein D3C84_984440 [compost metagenome]